MTEVMSYCLLFWIHIGRNDDIMDKLLPTFLQTDTPIDSSCLHLCTNVYVYVYVHTLY